MGNNMYDLYEVIVYWDIKHPEDKLSKKLRTFHLCVGQDVAKNFRALLADLNVSGLQEYAQDCSIDIKDGDQILITDTECHSIGARGFIRDIDISDMRNKYIIHKDD